LKFLAPYWRHSRLPQNEVSYMSSANAPKFSSWEELFKSTLIETDLEKLTVLAGAAEAAIVRRRQELSNMQGSDQERAAMVAAAVEILRIKTDKLGWPSVKSTAIRNPQPGVVEKVRRVESVHHWHR
jgi:hypothetical protein